MYRAAIYSDSDRINGIRFQSVWGTTQLGNSKGTETVQEFSPEVKLVGLHGTQNEEAITSLGFITLNTTCGGQ